MDSLTAHDIVCTITIKMDFWFLSCSKEKMIFVIFQSKEFSSFKVQHFSVDRKISLDNRKTFWQCNKYPLFIEDLKITFLLWFLFYLQRGALCGMSKKVPYCMQKMLYLKAYFFLKSSFDAIKANSWLCIDS